LFSPINEWLIYTNAFSFRQIKIVIQMILYYFEQSKTIFPHRKIMINVSFGSRYHKLLNYLKSFFLIHNYNLNDVEFINLPRENISICKFSEIRHIPWVKLKTFLSAISYTFYFMIYQDYIMITMVNTTNQYSHSMKRAC